MSQYNWMVFIVALVAPFASGQTVSGPCDSLVPTVTTADIFLFEDTQEELTADSAAADPFFTQLHAKATNALIEAHGDVFDFVGFFVSSDPPRAQTGYTSYYSIVNDVSGLGMNMFNARSSLGWSMRN